MKYSISLQKNSDFQFIYDYGISYANRYLVMFIKQNELEINRVGVSVSKKVGNSVIRHRVKRLIKESYRLHEEMFNSGLDIVVVARASAKGKNYEAIESALLHVSNLHGILKKEDGKND